MRVLVITTENEISLRNVDNYKDMRKIVDGNIEAVYPTFAYTNNLLLKDNCFVCDEEGWYHDREINQIATMLYNGLDLTSSPILGDIFIVGYDDEDFRGLNNNEIDFYLNNFRGDLNYGI